MKLNLTLRKIAAVFIWSLISLMGCQPTREIIHERLVYPDEVKKTPTSSNGNEKADGGYDAGGENGINGKPLESYLINISKTDEFVKIVDPILAELARLQPKLGRRIKYVAQVRSWFLVPVNLDELPKKLIGVAFQTDQLALQNKKEIYLSELHYRKMTDEDRGTQLLHELIMGVRLIEFQDNLDRCFVRIEDTLAEFPNLSPDDIKNKRSSCYQENSNPLDQGKRLVLTDADYANIRHLVSKLLSLNRDSWDSKEWELWLMNNHFYMQ